MLETFIFFMIEAFVFWGVVGAILILVVPVPESRKTVRVLITLAGPIVWLMMVFYAWRDRGDPGDQKEAKFYKCGVCKEEFSDYEMLSLHSASAAIPRFCRATATARSNICKLCIAKIHVAITNMSNPSEGEL